MNLCLKVGIHGALWYADLAEDLLGRSDTALAGHSHSEDLGRHLCSANPCFKGWVKSLWLLRRAIFYYYDSSSDSACYWLADPIHPDTNEANNEVIMSLGVFWGLWERTEKFAFATQSRHYTIHKPTAPAYRKAEQKLMSYVDGGHSGLFDECGGVLGCLQVLLGREKESWREGGNLPIQSGAWPSHISGRTQWVVNVWSFCLSDVEFEEQHACTLAATRENTYNAMKVKVNSLFNNLLAFSQHLPFCIARLKHHVFTLCLEFQLKLIKSIMSENATLPQYSVPSVSGGPPQSK